MTARAQVAAPAEVAAPAQPGYAWSPNPVTLPGQRPNPLLAQLGPVGNAIVKLAVFPRNEFLYHRFDLKPKATPFVVPETPDATTVNGTLNAHTQFGGPISVEVMTEPTNGTVTVTPDGFFTYTPQEALAGTPGNDKFTVEVTDEGFHLGSILGKIFGVRGHSTTADVLVSWDSLTPPPPGDSNKYSYAIWNYTGYTLTVSGYGDQQATTSAPPIGQVIYQGEAAYVTMEGSATKDKESTYYFDATGAGVAGVPPINSTDYGWQANTKLNYNYNGVYYYDQAVSCNAEAGDCHASSDGKNIYLYDFSGTNFYLPGTTAQEIDTQNTVINAFGADEDETSNINFLNPSSVIGYTPLTFVSGLKPESCPALATCTVETSSSSSVSNTAGHSQTIGVGVEIGTPKTYWINFQVSASYDYTWDKSVTTEATTASSFSVQLSTTEPLVSDSGYQIFPFQASPVIYTSGTTTVTKWNDTYNLLDTWYTFPGYSDATLAYPPYVFYFACPTGGFACQSMIMGIVPAGSNNMTDYADPNDPGYQECITDCDFYYGVSQPGAPVFADPITGLTLYSSVSYLPTYYLTAPVGTSLS